MANSISGGAAISNEDAIPSSSPVNADTETPSSLPGSEMDIDELAGAQDTGLNNKKREDILMPPPEIEADEIELPRLITRYEDSEPPKVFRSEIPDSDAISNESPIEDGENPECARIWGEAPSTFCGVDEVPPSSLDSSNESIVNKGLTTDAKEDETEQVTPSTLCGIDEVPPSSLDSSNESIANEVLTTGSKEDEIEQPVPSPRCSEPGGTQNIALEQADISSKAISTIPIEGGQVFNKAATEDNESSENTNAQGTETTNTPTFNILANGLAASEPNNANAASTFPTEKHSVELDTPVMGSSSPQACSPPINEQKGGIASGTVISSSVRPIDNVPNISSWNNDKRPPISPENKVKDFVSTKDSSSQTEVVEKGNSPQETDVKTPSTPMKRPESSQTKDIMMSELKAIKIASLQSRNAALEQEIAEKRAKLEEITKELMYPAEETVKKHITLLHDYNDIRDVGQGLIGMIADNRGVRIGELYDEFGVDLKD